jgi:WD40 repeat protein
LLALATGGRAIELWSASAGRLIGEYGTRPVSPRQVTYYGTRAREYAVEQQGYGNVIFSASGDLLVAGAVLDERTEVYRVGSSELVGTFWPSDTSFALHPEGEILATLSSDQLATAVRFGRLTDAFQGYNAQLNVMIDGYRRLVFSPKGDAFAVMGHSYAVGVRIYEFPSCRSIFELDFEDWKDIWGRLWKEYRGVERYPAKPDGSFTHDFISDLWTVNDRLAFHPDGRSLLLGTMEGLVVAVSLEDLSHPSGVWPVHDGPALALDVSASHGVLATARCDGEIKLWRLDGEAATPAPGGKSMTEAFLNAFEPIDAMAAEARFRTTDGKRWYDLETIGEEELDEDAPPWARIAGWMRQQNRPAH